VVERGRTVKEVVPGLGSPGRVYGRETDLEKGMTKVRALNPAGDRIRAMLIDGENTVVTDPDRNHKPR